MMRHDSAGLSPNPCNPSGEFHTNDGDLPPFGFHLQSEALLAGLHREYWQSTTNSLTGTATLQMALRVAFHSFPVMRFNTETALTCKM